MKKVCPVSTKLVDQNIVRFNSLLVLLFLISGYIFSYWVFLFLFLDFFLKVFTKKMSPLKKISEFFVKKVLKKEGLMVDAAPKVFSASLGLAFSGIVFLLLFFNFVFIAYILLIFFVTAVCMETFFGYCVGCRIYSFFQVFKKN